MGKSLKHRRSPRGVFATLLALVAVGAMATVALAATINGTDGPDTLIGTASKDTIKSKKGDDTAYGNPGNDRINGNEGKDTLHGGNGADDIDGDDGDDLIYGDGDQLICLPGFTPPSPYCVTSAADNPGGDELRGDDGNDELRGGDGDDHLLGMSGDDKVYGQDGNDVVEGGPGNDLLSGGAGNDTIRARDGRLDHITCGTGTDTVYSDKNLDVFDDSSCDTIHAAVFKK